MSGKPFVLEFAAMTQPLKLKSIVYPIVSKIYPRKISTQIE